VTKLLAKDPDDRWHSAHDLADVLRWIAEQPATAVAAAGHIAAGRSDVLKERDGGADAPVDEQAVRRVVRFSRVSGVLAGLGALVSWSSG